MLKKISLFIFLLFIGFSSRSQTTAQDWIKDDCDGNTHQLFNELDSGYVIMIEFVMQCGSCIAAANDLNIIYNDYQISHPDKFRYYMMDYSNGFSCDTMRAWAHGINCTFFLDGSHVLNYYGTFGMPTIVILGGINHNVFYNGNGFNPTYDIQYIRDAIDSALATTGVNEIKNIQQFNVFPNPASEGSLISYSLQTPSDICMDVYSSNGSLVKSFSFGKKGKGENKFWLNTDGMKKDIYSVVIFSETSFSKMQLLVVN